MTKQIFLDEDFERNDYEEDTFWNGPKKKKSKKEYPSWNILND